MSESQMTSTDQSLTTSQSTHERRRASRQAVIGAALVPVDFVPDATGGLLVNLSTAGMAVQGIARLKPGSFTRLRWKFDSQAAWMEVDAEIIWTDDFNLTGLRFLSPSPEAAAQIADWLGRFANNPVPQSAKDESEPFPVWSARSSVLPDAELHALVQQAQTISGADGAAIVIASGDEFICRATEGSAPELGSTLLAMADSNLSAECIRTGAVVCCADTESDTRVNTPICRQLGLRSALLVPIKQGETVFGVLECLWSRPHTCTPEDITALYALSESASRLVCAAEPVSTSEKSPETCEPQPSASETAAESAPAFEPPSDSDTAFAPLSFQFSTPAARLSYRPLLIMLTALLLFALGLGGYLWHIGKLKWW